mgnify:FL=1
MDESRMAAVARALGHPARVRILQLLAAQDACMGGEIFDQLPLAQSTISQHLGVLKESGLVHATPQGTRMLYCIDAGPVDELRAALEELVARRPVCSGKDA